MTEYFIPGVQNCFLQSDINSILVNGKKSLDLEVYITAALAVREREKKGGGGGGGTIKRKPELSQ